MLQLQPVLIIGTLINGWCINCSVLHETNIFVMVECLFVNHTLIIPSLKAESDHDHSRTLHV